MQEMVLSIMFVIAMVMFSYVGGHLINSLVVLEVMVLAVYSMMVLVGASGGIAMLQVMVLFVVSVSSASLGLSILVTLARSHGNDLFKSYSLLW